MNELVDFDNSSVPFPPKPPALQIQAELDTEGNWYYPNADQQNRDLRIQGEAFRAGAAARSGLTLPMHALQNSAPQASAPNQRRKILQPMLRRNSRSVKQAVGSGKKKKTSWAQACICHVHDHIPKRPQNAFLLFRTMKQRELKDAVSRNPRLRHKDKQGKDYTLQASISTLAAQWWDKAKKTGEANLYRDLAEKEKAEHASRNPGYKYQAGRKYMNKWGDENCTCGAYVANEAKRLCRERDGDVDADHHDNEAHGEDEEYEERQFLPARQQTQAKRAASRSSYMESPTKRRKLSAARRPTSHAEYPASFDDNSIFPTESYTHDEVIDFSGGMVDPQLARDLRPRSRHSSTIAPGTGSNAGMMTAQEYEDLFAVLDQGTVDHRALFSPTNAADYGHVQGEDVRGQRAGSFDSLFDMEGTGTGERSRRPSRAGSQKALLANSSGVRRSSRRSQG